jgi:hypothetical protein
MKPAVVTGTASVVSLAAVITAVLATSPQQASAALVVFLWIAAFLFAWSFLITFMLFMRQTLARSLWTSAWWAVEGIVLLMLFHRAILTKQLLIYTVLATLVLSVLTWWFLRSNQSSYDRTA